MHAKIRIQRLASAIPHETQYHMRTPRFGRAVPNTRPHVAVLTPDLHPGLVADVVALINVKTQNPLGGWAVDSLLRRVGELNCVIETLPEKRKPAVCTAGFSQSLFQLG